MRILGSVTVFAFATVATAATSDVEVLSRELSANAGIRQCFKRADGARRSVGEKVLLEIRVNAEGEPLAVRAQKTRGFSQDPVLNKCVEDVVQTLKFPAPQNGPSEFQVPVSLSEGR